MLTLPNAEDRTVVIGATGDGKTIMAGWLLSKQRLEKRAWVWIDFKDEELLDKIGSPPVRKLKLDAMPGKVGLYRLTVYPGQEDQLEAWLWRIWKRGNVGILCDEVSLVPQRDAFKALLRQGRTKWIPIISCTQRPVDCDREVFSEAQYRVLFTIGDLARDWLIIKGLFGGHDVRRPLPRFHCYWYDVRARKLLVLPPVPDPARVAAAIREAAPRSIFAG